MSDERRIQAALLTMRWATAAFLLVWAIDKIVSPKHAQAVFAKYYLLQDASHALLVTAGLAQVAVILAFAAGWLRAWSYGAVLLMHLVSTASTLPHLLMPWAQGSQLLFWAAVPVLAAMLALFVLRDLDRLFSIDATMQSRD